MSVWLISLLSVCRPCVHIRMRILVLCLKLEEINLLIDRFTYVEKMVIVYSNQKNRIKMGFLYSVLFYGHLNRLFGFVTL